MRGPTKGQQRVLDTLDKFMDEGKTPTLARMAEHLEITKGGVQQHLLSLRSKGLVTWEPRHAGTVRRVKPSIRIVGSVD